MFISSIINKEIIEINVGTNNSNPNSFDFLYLIINIMNSP